MPVNKIEFEFTRQTSRVKGYEPQSQTVSLTPREAIKASTPAHVLVSADFKQIELRLLLHYCEEPEIISMLTASTMDHRNMSFFQM